MIRVAVIGTGRMGLRHLEAAARIGARVTAIADCNPSALAAARERVPDATASGEWRTLLAGDRFDLLSVATTSAGHAEIVCSAAEAGVKRILCEKPLSTSLADGAAMVAACRHHGARLVVNHSRRASSAYVRLSQTLGNDEFGGVRFMRVTCGAAGLANIGTHAFDLFRWFLGDAERVIGYVDSNPLENPRGPAFHDPGGHGLIEFPAGRRATFDFSNDFSTSFTVEFGCRYGRAIVDERRGTVDAFVRTASERDRPLFQYQASTVAVALPFGGPLDIVDLTAGMMRSALDDNAPACAGEDALAALEIAAAVHLSDAAAHAPIALPVTNDRGVLAAIP